MISISSAANSILLRLWAVTCCPKGPHVAGAADGAASGGGQAHTAVLGPPLERAALNSRVPVIAPTCAWVSFVGSFEQ